ncbi:hypothetical protein [Hoylesella loescheii]|jgi:hypothetical protein|uniref:Uncharacterized protein n=1 Tax=Hoylesella loescheii DSM 19665 = JCM 12249 = ATCC 15930 TaxID=1122985 RepID=A0A069QLW4_HOYLO|nr:MULTISPECIES: hypothetical protein [Prevotellaceae]EEX53886.1 hypothetical protein HMPREF6745_0642 [Prevotella sp. oral taxon 472 str. F0295]KDR53853.1 hypothetical protein HMPREF1991_00053 [Hoylesella loescheii DSM 19665 = JCM 12249 = ATCC 15930]
MKKQAYTKPNCTAVYFDLDELLRAPGASSFDNDGDGNTDQRPIVPGDPDEIGAKPGFGWGWDDEDDI